MKHSTFRAWLLTGIALLPLSLLAGTAQVRLSNNSVRMYPGDCACGWELTWTIYFSSLYTEDSSQANGELVPSPQPAAYSHRSYLILEDPSMTYGVVPAELDVPLGDDTDGDGTPDFLDVAQPISTTTSGTYPDLWGNGPEALSLTWTRSAGSRQGTCQLYMQDSILGLMGPFNHVFELIERTGTLTYSPAATNVAGNLVLTAADGSSDALAGTVLLVKSPTNRFNLLTLSSGECTNQVEVFSFGDCQLFRDPAHPSVYRGTLQNPYGTYATWSFSLLDANDSNGNGIPDLSDDVALSPPRRPALALSATPSGLVLRVRGDVGRTHVVQEAASPDSTTWKTVQSFTLTNDPQEVTLPLPAEPPTFWRVLAQ